MEMANGKGNHSRVSPQGVKQEPPLEGRTAAVCFNNRDGDTLCIQSDERV